jgi:hypothetical protein
MMRKKRHTFLIALAIVGQGNAASVLLQGRDRIRNLFNINEGN